MGGGFQKQKHLKNSPDFKKPMCDKKWQHDSLPADPFQGQMRALVSPAGGEIRWPFSFGYIPTKIPCTIRHNWSHFLHTMIALSWHHDA
ncbi:hypothetical protein U1438_03215 [Aeromonas caviae]|uniref:hypothetical protein n=1 Tax=Aeromonas caviae TaxID=648 RepID=UPI003014384E